MALDQHTGEFIADLICGDDARSEVDPADGLSPVCRSGGELTCFMVRAGLSRFQHDGTTRKWCVLAGEDRVRVLKALDRNYEREAGMHDAEAGAEGGRVGMAPLRVTVHREWAWATDSLGCTPARSATFAERGQRRNIECEVLVRDAQFGSQVLTQWDRLIGGELLEGIDLGE